MQLDLFYELSVPAHSGRDEQQVYADTLEELVLADRLGFGAAWLVEHHLMPEYSHSSAPDLFLAAAAQRTRHLRLGLAVVPLPYHHPVQVAERAATLDLLSGGRLELGLGRGFDPAEQRLFGVAPAAARSMMLESIDILRRLFAGDAVSFRGEHYTLEGVRLLPRPVQRPHPPLWLAAVSPESYDQAAALGLGVLAGPFKPWVMIRRDLHRYRRACTAPTPVPANRQLAMTAGILCLEDGTAARRLAADCFPWFYHRLLETTAPVLERLVDGYRYYRRLGRFRHLLRRAATLPVLERLGLVIAGDPAHCTRALARLRAAGVDRVLCAVGAGAVDTAVVRESLEVLAREVAPALAQAA